MRRTLRLAVQRSVHRKQSQRIAGLFGLIDRAAFQRHRYRVRLIGAGIVELAVDENRHGNQRRLPALRELQDAYGSRSFNLFFRLGFFRNLFRSSLLRPFQLRRALRDRIPRNQRRDKSQNPDDGQPRSAV
jgi:hypothetical protein